MRLSTPVILSRPRIPNFPISAILANDPSGFGGCHPSRHGRPALGHVARMVGLIIGPHPNKRVGAGLGPRRRAIEALALRRPGRYLTDPLGNGAHGRSQAPLFAMFDVHARNIPLIAD